MTLMTKANAWLNYHIGWLILTFISKPTVKLMIWLLNLNSKNGTKHPNADILQTQLELLEEMEKEERLNYEAEMKR